MFKDKGLSITTITLFIALLALPLAPTVASAKQKKHKAATSAVVHKTGSTASDDADSETETKPYTWGLYYTGDVWRGFQGGLAGRAAYIGNLDYQVTLNNEKIFGWKGNSLFFEWQHLDGQKPSRYLKSLQGFDNFDATTNFTKLHQFYIDQKFGPHDQLDVLVGLYDFSYEFYLVNSSSIFLFPAFGTGSEFGQAGVNGPSVYPVSSVATRFKWTPNANWYLQGAVADAVAGSPEDPAGTYFRLSPNDGALVMAEGGYNFLDSDQDSTGKLALGAWGFTSKFDDNMDVDDNGNPIKHHNSGVYALIDLPLYLHPDNEKRGLHGFLFFGFANNAVNTFNKALGIGLTYHGPFHTRPEDIFGMGYAPAWVANKAQQANPGYPKKENQYECTYIFKVNQWLSLQPTVQWIRFTGSDNSTYKNSMQAGLRVSVAFS
jgi:porin